MSDRLRIAVIGSGVAGLTAAYVLDRRHEVTLFEQDDRLGGHAHTVLVPTGDGRQLPVDTGFIVLNDRTYPSLLRLFRELGVDTRPSDMSFGVRCEGCELEYAGARGLAGVVARPSMVLRARYLRMLTEISLFHRHARRVLDRPERSLTVDGFLREGRYSRFFADHFLLALIGAVWSSSPETMRGFPASYLFRFLANHGMLSVFGSLQWRTVTGGSRVYVERIAGRLGGRVRSGCGVAAVERDPSGVTVTDVRGDAERFDRVVIATHPDQARRLLADPSPEERAVLGRFRYVANETLLHTDTSLLPRSRGARSSWNYLLDVCSTEAPEVHATYHLNRLQALDTPVDYCVTLNQTARIDPSSVLRRMVYEHPVYDLDTVAAQRLLPSLNGRRHTAFCGAYHGFGFHEDGCASGVRAAAALGVRW